MATFEVKVEGLTGLSIHTDTTPTQDELSEFLTEGVIDVTNRWLAVKPQDVDLFMVESGTIDSNSGLNTKGGKVISVMREAGGDASADGTKHWRPCRKLPAALKSRVIDTDSLHYASLYNPAYIIDNNGFVNVYPVASANNGFRVFYINNVPKGDGTSSDLTYAHSYLGYFPKEKEYLVVIYASIRALQAKMSEYVMDEEDLELEQGIGIRVSELQKQYDAAFMMHQVQQQQQKER